MIKIYILIDPRTEEIRYVGKTEMSLRRRLTSGHFTEARASQHKRARWLAKLLRLGYRPRIELIQEVPGDCWEMAEQYWIGYYRSLGCDLTNGTEGGDGGNSPTPEVRAKMSDAKQGKIPTWLVGKPQSAEQRANIGAGNRGKKRTPEQLAEMSATRQLLFATHCRNGHLRTPENTKTEGDVRRCLDCRAERKGQEVTPGPKHTPETKAKMSAAKKGRHKTHCVHGHEFTPENTKWEDGHQRCITCRREGQRRRAQTKR